MVLKCASIFHHQEVLFKFVLESKSTKNLTFHGFSTCFCIRTTREVLPNIFYRKVEQKQNLFSKKAIPNRPLIKTL
jgi:hypothetical protein